MGIKDLIEEALKAAVAKNLKPEVVKDQLHKMVDKFVDDKLNGIIEDIYTAIDKIDGEVG